MNITSLAGCDPPPTCPPHSRQAKKNHCEFAQKLKPFNWYLHCHAILLHNHEDSCAISRGHIDVVLQDGWTFEDLSRFLLSWRRGMQQDYVTYFPLICDIRSWIPTQL